MSKSTGISYDFGYGECEGPMNLKAIIGNRNPQDFVHVLALDDRRRPVFEIRELRNVEFLANYRPSVSPGTSIPNPIKDHERYALGALRLIDYSRFNSVTVDDLAALAPIALQPLTAKGEGYSGNSDSSAQQALGARYVGLKYSIISRDSLFTRDDQERLRLKDPFIVRTGWCLYLVEGDDWVSFQYSELPEWEACEQIRPQLIKRFSRSELITHLSRETFVYHDWTSTRQARIKGIKLLFEGRSHVDLVLYAQDFRREKEVWRVTGQGYVGRSSRGRFVVNFDEAGLITEVIGPVR